MGSVSWWHWLIVLFVVLLLFGGGKKIPELFKGLGTGIKGFKKAVRDDDDEIEQGNHTQRINHARDNRALASPESSAMIDISATSAISLQEPQAPRKRGRPKGSKNKPKAESITTSVKSSKTRVAKTSTKKAKSSSKSTPKTTARATKKATKTIKA